MEIIGKPNNRTATQLLTVFMASGISISTAYSNTFEEALTSGKASIDMRLRMETVDDSINKDAGLTTLRTRLGYETGDYKNSSALIEYEDVRAVGSDDEYYLGDATVAANTGGYAVIADPEVTQLNQAFFTFKSISNSTVKLGRQRIILDNARFVGNVGWRQNEQTFDAVTISNTALPQTTITYSYIDKVNGILPKFDADTTNHIINMNYSGFAAGTLTAYGYLTENDISKAENDTIGLRFSGNADLSEGKELLYTAEYASQDTNTNKEASYLFIEVGTNINSMTAKLGYEVLGSDSGSYGFQTPMATKHAFNGWADMFLVTPVTGLQDTIVTLSSMLGGAKLLAAYHDYSADEGSSDYGSEIDLLAVKNFGKRYSLGIKHASFDADTSSIYQDTDKLWIWGQLKI